MFGTGTALDLHLSLIVTGVTADDESAPVARFTVAFGLFRGKYDGFLGSTLSIEFSAGFYNESGFGLFVAFDDSARFDGEFGSTGDVNPAFEQVSAFGESSSSLQAVTAPHKRAMNAQLRNFLDFIFCFVFDLIIPFGTIMILF